jgi:hypothetical protein
LDLDPVQIKIGKRKGLKTKPDREKKRIILKAQTGCHAHGWDMVIAGAGLDGARSWSARLCW